MKWAGREFLGLLLRGFPPLPAAARQSPSPLRESSATTLRQPPAAALRKFPPMLSHLQFFPPPALREPPPPPHFGNLRCHFGPLGAHPTTGPASQPPQYHSLLQYKLPSLEDVKVTDELTTTACWTPTEWSPPMVSQLSEVLLTQTSTNHLFTLSEHL